MDREYNVAVYMYRCPTISGPFAGRCLFTPCFSLVIIVVWKVADGLGNDYDRCVWTQKGTFGEMLASSREMLMAIKKNMLPHSYGLPQFLSQLMVPYIFFRKNRDRFFCIWVCLVFIPTAFTCSLLRIHCVLKCTKYSYLIVSTCTSTQPTHAATEQVYEFPFSRIKFRLDLLFRMTLT